ncbi:hypothetical protein E4T56_gene1389 [Termitomyces sp. T112]|nr:hypothetical protein E4T56_gene1389 [Termitomyces sp. T112]
MGVKFSGALAFNHGGLPSQAGGGFNGSVDSTGGGALMCEEGLRRGMSREGGVGAGTEHFSASGNGASIREPPRKPSHLHSNSGRLVISAEHRVRLVRTRQCTEPLLSAEPDIISRLPLTLFLMSAFNPAYNLVGYPTDAYGQPLLENPYAPFYPGPFADQEYPWAGATLPHSTPMAIIPVSTPEDTPQHPPTPPTFPSPITMRIQSPLQPQSLRSLWITIPPPHPPFAAQTPPSPRQQRVEAYAQQCNKVLCFLHLSPAEFARHTRTLLTNLGYPNTSATLELHALVEEIHTSPNPRPFEDPLDSARSFHVQHEEPIGTQSEAPSSISCQQEELNAASSILRNLNPVGGLFDQPAAHTLALSTRPQASSVPSAFQTWDQPATPELRSQRPPLRVNNDNQTLFYIDEPGNPADKHAPHNRPQ